MPYSQYTREDREALQFMEALRLPRHSMAVILGKAVSTIYRELARNTDGGLYTAAYARQFAESRRALTKPCPKTGNAALMREVTKLFKADWSPEQIAGRLSMENPDKPGNCLSHETIYRFLYGQMKREPELKAHFRHRRAKRKSRNAPQDRRGQIPDRLSIEQRPAIVDAKVRAGDWEGDTVEGAGKTAYIATFVDKKTKYLAAKVMPDKSASTLNSAAVRAFKSIPQELVKTLTVDNGKEFARHIALAEKLGCPVYFAHPYHSWERGLNEHTNGLLRQYFPKGMSFDTLTQQQLDKKVWAINNRPRKSLGFRTPAEVFASACSFALQI